jgi:hypothetical protein
MGTQFIGDNIKRFKAGDVVLVGSNLPHYWRFDDAYFEENPRTTADVRVVHFCEDFWGNNFLDLPENVGIKSVLEKAKRGLQITGKTKHGVAEILEELLNTEGTQRIILLIKALLIICGCKQLETLASMGFKSDFMESENDPHQ